MVSPIFKTFSLEAHLKLADDIGEIESLLGSPIKKDYETIRGLLPDYSKSDIQNYLLLRGLTCTDLSTKAKQSFY